MLFALLVLVALVALFATVVTMERRGRSRSSAAYRVAVAALVLLGLLIAAFFVSAKAYRIPSRSMEPALQCGEPVVGCRGDESDRVLALRFFLGRNPERGDVVAYESVPEAETRCGAGGTHVHRIVGLAGETVSARRGVVSIDGRELEEPYLAESGRGEDSFPSRRVPPGHVFVLGDNRTQSCDSRIWGPLPVGNLIARVVFRYWPPGRVGRL